MVIMVLLHVVDDVSDVV